MKIIFSSLLFLVSSVLFSQAQSEFSTNEIIVKFNSELSNKCNKSQVNIPAIQELINENNVTSIRKVFPNHRTPKLKSLNSDLVDLSTIYKLKVSNSTNVQKLINSLNSKAEVAYAELRYKNTICFTPNDTLNSNQYYLSAIKAYEAWDVQQGDTNVVIGIGDTGIDSDHPDMINEYAKNYNDPINGIDDDNDGYVDNFMGWDTGNNDNNPELGALGHGINVSGIASASTNNVTGISGVGFNTKILAIRIDNDSIVNDLPGAYEGIVYAADYGAPIVSNSWGSHFYSQFGQDVVNYAALNKGCLVIAATGNNGNENEFYPAAYDNVLAVGATQFGDTMKSNSNYGYWTDIYAPGDNMLTCNAIGGYGTNGGTSMAAPVVAGVAGLIKSQFPNYTWRQITEQIINTGDDIYAINDTKYNNKLGGGRVNAFKAVTEINKPGIALINKLVTDNNDNIFLAGETIQITGYFKNLLANASNVVISATTVNNRLQLLSNNINVGQLDSQDSVSINNNPISFKIPNNLEPNELVYIEITITATNYSKKIFIPVLANVTYLNINENNLALSATSNGSIGYADANQGAGQGIKYKDGESLLYEGSFMVGNSSTFIANKFRGDNSNDDDFDIVNPIKEIASEVADFESSSIFNDGKLNSPPMVEVRSKNFAYKDSIAENSVIYEYTITNTSGADLTDMYAGLILDWDIHNYSSNKITYNSQRSMGISFATDTPLYCGVRPLNDSISTFHYAMDNTQTGEGGINLTDGFTDAEKFQTLKTFRNSAGGASVDGNDIIDVNSIGPFDLKVNEKITIGFVITITDDFNELLVESDSIKNLYKSVSVSLNNIEKENSQSVTIFPNPVRNDLQVRIELEKADKLDIQITDLKGSVVYLLNNKAYNPQSKTITLSNLELENGIYFIKINGNAISFQDKFVVAK